MNHLLSNFLVRAAALSASLLLPALTLGQAPPAANPPAQPKAEPKAKVEPKAKDTVPKKEEPKLDIPTGSPAMVIDTRNPFGGADPAAMANGFGGIPGMPGYSYGNNSVSQSMSGPGGWGRDASFITNGSVVGRQPADKMAFGIPSLVEPYFPRRQMNGGPSGGQALGQQVIALASEHGAIVSVQVPPDAEVFLQGVKMNQSGPLRRFQSPSLKPGQDYIYTVKVRWSANGTLHEQSVQVPVRSGDSKLVIVPGPEKQNKDKVPPAKPNRG